MFRILFPKIWLLLTFEWKQYKLAAWHMTCQQPSVKIGAWMKFEKSIPAFEIVARRAVIQSKRMIQFPRLVGLEREQQWLSN